MERRSFLLKLTALSAGLAGLAALIPGVGFFFAPFFEKKPNMWRSVGPASGFDMDSTTEVTFEDPSSLPWAGVVAKTAAWLRRKPDGEFIAFAVNCTHLGCPVRWEKDADLFLCPCHGGVYNKEGNVVGGPPPKPLTQYQVRTVNNDVQILTANLPID